MFCTLLNLSIGVTQIILDVLFGFWALFGIPAPDLRAGFGSIFGCNI